MKTRTVFWGVVLVMTAIASVMISRTVKHNKKLRSGYCFAQERYLTDKEIIDAAVAGTIELFNKQQSTLAEEDRHPDLQFSSVEDFYEKNPYCCYPVVEPLQRHVNYGPVEIDEFGVPVYEPSIMLTVDGKTFYTNSVWVSLCGEKLKASRVKLRGAGKGVSTLTARPNSQRPDRRIYGRKD
jgi:hypothetical protein